MRIQVSDVRAWDILASMADGMWENARDDNETARAGHLERLAELFNEVEATSLPIPDDLREQADAVLENCMDNASGGSREDDPDWERDLFQGDAWLDHEGMVPDISLDEALSYAMMVLRQRSWDAPAVAALQWLDELKRQRGCDAVGQLLFGSDYREGEHDRLTACCEVIIRG